MKFCANCGTRMEDDYKTCPACGTPAMNNEVQQSAPAEPAPAINENPAPAYAPQPQYQAPQPQYQAPQPQYQAPQPQYQAPQPQTVVYNNTSTVPVTKEQLPEELRPMSAWAYLGYDLLFMIPIAGFIIWIVCCFKGGNINRRSYARHFFCWFLLGLIGFAILFLIGLIVFGSAGGFTELFQ